MCPEYRGPVTRFTVDPPTLLLLAERPHELDPAHRLVAPNAIRSQALDLLLAGVRRGDLSEKGALALHDAMTGIKMRLLGDRVSRRVAWQIAREHDWETIAEAEYLAVAKLQADALVTVNRDLAARASGIVPLEPVSVLFGD